MKNSIKNIFGIICILAMVATSSAQVSVGTTAPEGMLDLQNNDSYGFVFPKVALTASNTASPVVNPKGGALIPGTVVFNTATTSTGSFDVSPGIYAWNGTVWNPQYHREDSELFEQFPLDLRTTTGSTAYNNASSDWVYVPGLGSGSTFTAKYTGIYRVKVNFNYGAGRTIPPASGKTRMSTTEGLFRFTLDGVKDLIYTHSYSIYNRNINGGTYFEEFKHDSSHVIYRHLVAGQTYNFSLEIDIFVATETLNNGNSGAGRGHVGIGVPCTVEFTFTE